MSYRDCDQDSADLQSHHIEGFACAAQEAGLGNAYFDVPMISHIWGNLWMGGCTDGVRLDDDFIHVVSLYPWERYELGPTTCRAEFQLYDSNDLPPITSLMRITDYVRSCLDEGKTLVHCQAGLNRSGLISAFTLIRDDWYPSAAIKILREKRHELVLCNATFEKWLLEQP